MIRQQCLVYSDQIRAHHQRRAVYDVETPPSYAGFNDRREIAGTQRFGNYGVSEIEGAFRYIQSGANSGKMVIDMRLDELVLVFQRILSFLMQVWS